MSSCIGKNGDLVVLTQHRTLKLFYSELQPLSLPEGHRFPAPKYHLLIERVLGSDDGQAFTLWAAEPATDEQLLSVHTEDYLNRMTTGRMTEKEMRRIGFPWTERLVERSRRSVGATIAACRTALAEGLAANLGGGTHHAYPDHGEGYCVFNDVAVAIRAMQREGLAERFVILDCDVHQGNGTAAIFSQDFDVFTFSIHGSKNFPFHKELSDLDIGLPDGSRDPEFLEALVGALERLSFLTQADLAIYVAGADPFEGDRLGRMALSKEGLAERDRLVLSRCRDWDLPIAIVMGGGYAREIEDTVDIHFHTLQIACEF
jgi:acetoin utilization deacetylase AcuC-like enzyme